MKVGFPNELRATAGRALAGGFGTMITPAICRVHACGKCNQPLVIESWSRPPAKEKHKDATYPEDGSPFGLDIVAGCRKCVECRKARITSIIDRSERESLLSSRVWFGTLTMRPDWHNPRHLDYSLTDVSERRKRAVAELQKYFKRVRKAAMPHKFRYLYVVENHKSGLPHIHLLVYEQSHGSVTKRLLDDWRKGYTYWRLVDDIRQCTYYCAKYLLKEDDTFVRASKWLGSLPPLGKTVNQSLIDQYGTPMTHTPQFDPWSWDLDLDSEERGFQPEVTE